MFPIATTEIVTAERSRRLEGFRTWSRRRNRSTPADVDETSRPLHGHRPTLRAAVGR